MDQFWPWLDIIEKQPLYLIGHIITPTEKKELTEIKVIRAHIGDVVLEELLLGGVALRRSRGQKVALLGGIFGAT